MRNGLRILIAVLLAALGSGLAQQAEPPSAAELQKRLDSAQKRLQDWAQLGRYADANAQLPAPRAGEKRVVFLGDSITDSWKLDQYFSGKPYVNRGISGQTTPQMLVRMRPDVINLKPAAVLILAGTNDIAGNTGPMTDQQVEENYQSIAELAQAHRIKVIFASVLPVHNYTERSQRNFEQRSPQRILALNKFLKEYCAAHHFLYLDYFSAMVDEHGLLKRDLAEDGLHPNDAGYKLMAPLAEKAIRQAVGR